MTLNLNSDFILIETEEQFKEIILLLGTERKALDVETYVLFKYKHLGLYNALSHPVSRISLLTIKSEKVKPAIVFDLLKLENHKEIADLLIKSEYLIAHNAKFEWQQIYYNFGIKLENLHCTLQLAKLHANATGSKFARLRELSLKALLRDFYDVRMTGKGKEQISDWYPRPDTNSPNYQEQLAYWNEKVKYAAYDVVYLFQLHDDLEKVLTDPIKYSSFQPNGATKKPYGLGQKYVVEQSYYMIAVIGEMELNGFPGSSILKQITDNIYLEEGNSGYLMEIASKICIQLKLETVPTLWEEYPIPTSESIKALNNPQKLCRLIAENTGLPLDTAQTQTLQRIVALLEQLTSSSDIEWADEEENAKYAELEQLESSTAIKYCELAKLIIEYKKLFKLWGMSLERHIHTVTGCIHSSYQENGAATGRTSSNAPNGQNISGRTKVKVVRPLDNLFS